MIRVLIVLIVLVLGLTLGRCGNDSSNTGVSGCSGYPSCVGESKSVYYGPPVTDADQNQHRGYRDAGGVPCGE